MGMFRPRIRCRPGKIEKFFINAGLQPAVDKSPPQDGGTATTKKNKMEPPKEVNDMKLGDRILELRKQKGISQEALADQLGVSRQAISKWESEQSTPELDKIILMSDFFEISTDYLLKGIEPVKNENETSRRVGNALSLLSPWMAWIGYITSCALWYEYQNAFAVMDGFIWMIGSVVVIYVAKLNRTIEQKAVDRYWMISFPEISIFILSLLYNAIVAPITFAPYPLIYGNRYVLLGIWLLVLICVNIVVEMTMYKRIKQ